MKESIKAKLEHLSFRYEELNTLLADPELIANREKYAEFSKEFATLEPVVRCFAEYNKCLSDLSIAEELVDEDAELRVLALEEIKAFKIKLEELALQLQGLLLPTDPNDICNVFLEVRAGTGGDEAAIFAGDLFRMYARYAEGRGWTVEILNTSHGEHGGYKEIISRIIGTGVYGTLKFESGTHRVQRVPLTEAQGRIHTSACTVAVLPEVEAINSISINPSDLKVDTYRASGAGGQHVNRTESAIRITHMPTGVVVECQDDRSQHKNRAKAMALLQSRLLATMQKEQRDEQDSLRRNLVGSGDRSERIRTYNYPQGRVTDHRINLTLYKLPDIMNGDLACVIEPLIQEHHADLLAKLNAE